MKPKKSGSRATTNIVGMPDTGVSRQLVLTLVRVLEGAEGLLGAQFEDLLAEHKLRLPALAEVLSKFLEGADEQQLEQIHYKAVNAPIADILEALNHAVVENKALQEQLAQKLYASSLAENGGFESRFLTALTALYGDMEASADLIRDQNTQIEAELERQQARAEEAQRFQASETEDYLLPLGKQVVEVQEFVRGFQGNLSAITEAECAEADSVIQTARASAEAYQQMRQELQNLVVLSQQGDATRAGLLADGRTVLAELNTQFSTWRNWCKLLSEVSVDLVTLLGHECDLTPFERRAAQFGAMQTAMPRKIRLREASVIGEQLLEVCRELEQLVSEARVLLVTPVPVFEPEPPQASAPEVVTTVRESGAELTHMEEMVLLGFTVSVTELSRGRTAKGIFKILCIADYLNAWQEQGFMEAFARLCGWGYLVVSRDNIFYIPTPTARAEAERILSKAGSDFAERMKRARREKDENAFGARRRR